MARNSQSLLVLIGTFNCMNRARVGMRTLWLRRWSNNLCARNAHAETACLCSTIDPNEFLIRRRIDAAASVYRPSAKVSIQLRRTPQH